MGRGKNCVDDPFSVIGRRGSNDDNPQRDAVLPYVLSSDPEKRKIELDRLIRKVKDVDLRNPVLLREPLEALFQAKEHKLNSQETVHLEKVLLTKIQSLVCLRWNNALDKLEYAYWAEDPFNLTLSWRTNFIRKSHDLLDIPPTYDKLESYLQEKALEELAHLLAVFTNNNPFRAAEPLIGSPRKGKRKFLDDLADIPSERWTAIWQAVLESEEDDMLEPEEIIAPERIASRLKTELAPFITK